MIFTILFVCSIVNMFQIHVRSVMYIREVAKVCFPDPVGENVNPSYLEVIPKILTSCVEPRKTGTFARLKNGNTKYDEELDVFSFPFFICRS